MKKIWIIGLGCLLLFVMGVQAVQANNVAVPEFFGIYLAKNGKLLEVNWMESELYKDFERVLYRSNTQTDNKPTFVVYFSDKRISQFEIVQLKENEYNQSTFGDSCKIKRGPVLGCPDAYRIIPTNPLPEGDYAVVYKEIYALSVCVTVFADFTVLPRELLEQKSPAETVKTFLTAIIEENVSEVRKYASSGFLKEMEGCFGSVEEGTKEISNFEKFKIIEEHISSKLAIVQCDFYFKDGAGGKDDITLIRENGVWKVAIQNFLTRLPSLQLLSQYYEVHTLEDGSKVCDVHYKIENKGGPGSYGFHVEIKFAESKSDDWKRTSKNLKNILIKGRGIIESYVRFPLEAEDEVVNSSMSLR